MSSILVVESLEAGITLVRLTRPDARHALIMEMVPSAAEHHAVDGAASAVCETIAQHRQLPQPGFVSRQD